MGRRFRGLQALAAGAGCFATSLSLRCADTGLSSSAADVDAALRREELSGGAADGI